MSPTSRLLYFTSARLAAPGKSRGLRPGATALPSLGSFAPAALSARLHLSSQWRGIHGTPVRMSSTTPSRSLHSSSTRSSAEELLLTPTAHDLTTSPSTSTTTTSTDFTKQSTMSPRPPLSVLPLTAIIRSLITTTISSSPLLLPPSMTAMSLMAHSTYPLLNPDRNPLLHALMKHTFYAQYCAGENAGEVRRTVASLKQMGFSGVILGYAREVVLSAEQTKDLASCGEGRVAEECVRNEITPWAEGTRTTVRMAERGDFVALKFTGAGRQALWTLTNNLPPSEELGKAIDGICELARERGVRLLFDAEQQAVQGGIDGWTVRYMRRYNRGGKAVVYGTYQAYLKGTPGTLGGHLEVARREGWTVGVKLVRGAYLGSDPRNLIHDTKGETDECYDGIAAALLRRRWNETLKMPGEGDGEGFADVELVLASHNAVSVRKAREIVDKGEAATEVAFAQLQGMADEVSCELVAPTDKDEKSGRVKAYKYLVWGSTGECMKYLLRRAHENRDAVQRTRSGRDAMARELWRRMKGVFGLEL